ncbi:MAG: Na+/H+ antiporter NhaA [Sandaracinaceae bacterium]
MPRAPIDRLLRPITAFAEHRLAGAGLLLAAAVAAMGWAGSPWAHSYHALLEVPFELTLGEWTLRKSLHHWVNDGLMGIFFFLVGLEIKREVMVGELSTLRRASLPAISALGGMVVPALVYVAINRGGPTADGWGIPMATDIAFALGVLALLGDRVPRGLRVFLTALAIADDIGAVLVIALFYTDELSLVSLAIGVALLLGSIVMNLLGVRSVVAYLVVGLLAWLAFLESGVHATIAALLMALTIPARTRIDGAEVVERLTGLLGRLKGVGVPTDTAMNSREQQGVFDEMDVAVDEACAPLQRIENALSHPVTFLVLPVFAFANAGVTLTASVGDALRSPLALGVGLGLLLGKPIGIVLSAWIAVKTRVADLPAGVGYRHVLGAGMLAGIGFTMALFIASLAFEDAAHIEVAKLAIFAGSGVAAVLGSIALRIAPSEERPPAETG